MFNKLFSEGDTLVNLMKREVDKAPYAAKNEMNQNWLNVSSKWNEFKSKSKNQSVAVTLSPSGPQSTLSQSIGILERTGDSLMRAEQVAMESETVGVEVIADLGEQREQLLKTRERLDGTNVELKRTDVIISSIHRRVLTNKCLLILIIILEVIILVCAIYYRIFR